MNYKNDIELKKAKYKDAFLNFIIQNKRSDFTKIEKNFPDITRAEILAYLEEIEQDGYIEPPNKYSSSGQYSVTAKGEIFAKVGGNERELQLIREQKNVSLQEHEKKIRVLDAQFENLSESTKSLKRNKCVPWLAIVLSALSLILSILLAFNII